MVTVDRIAAFLDNELNVSAFDDASNNGLQVQNSGRVGRVCCGVDASVSFLEEAARRGAGLVVCHHGISWVDSLKRITEQNYLRVSRLIGNDIALYAAHLPLDAHPRYGNNALICKALGLRGRKPFGLYHGTSIGFEGVLPRPMPYGRFKKLVQRVTGGELRTMDFGPKTVRTVAVVSGGAAGELAEAGRKGIDAYVTGEPRLDGYYLAQEYGVNAVFAGHYATEVFGVRALAGLLKRRFKLLAEFVDFNVPY